MTTPDKPRTTEAADTTPAPYTTRLTPNGYDRYVTAPDGKPAGYVADARRHRILHGDETARRFTASNPTGLILGYYSKLTDATLRVAQHDEYARSIPDDASWDDDPDDDAPETSTDLPCDGTGWVCGRCDHKRSDGVLLDFHDGPQTEWRPLPYIERVGDHTCQVCETTAPGFRRLYGYWELPHSMITTTTDAPAARDYTTPNDRELVASYRLAQEDVREAQAEVDGLAAEMHRRGVKP